MCCTFRATRRIRIQIDEREAARGIHLATIEQHRGLDRPFTAPSEEFDSVELLALAELRERRQR